MTVPLNQNFRALVLKGGENYSRNQRTEYSLSFDMSLKIAEQIEYNFSRFKSIYYIS